MGINGTAGGGKKELQGVFLSMEEGVAGGVHLEGVGEHAENLGIVEAEGGKNAEIKAS